MNMLIGARRTAGLNVSQTADLLGFAHTAVQPEGTQQPDIVNVI